MCARRYVARLGEYDLVSSNDGANPIDMIIEKRIVHEQYVSNIVLNDIALLKLQGTAPLTGTYTSPTPSVCFYV